MEPTIKDLLARVEAAEARAEKAEKAALQGQDVVGKIESKLESQESLERRSAANRAENMRRMLPDSKFWMHLRGVQALAADRLQQQEALLKEQAERIATLEALVLEKLDPKPEPEKPKGPKGK
jgi:uncharacterized sporulation protein YeaH/YhbH (DUF444 family)